MKFYTSVFKKLSKKRRMAAKFALSMVLFFLFITAYSVIVQAKEPVLQNADPFPYDKYSGKAILVHDGMYSMTRWDNYDGGEAFYITVYEPKEDNKYYDTINLATQSGHVWIGLIDGERIDDFYEKNIAQPEDVSNLYRFHIHAN